MSEADKARKCLAISESFDELIQSTKDRLSELEYLKEYSLKLVQDYQTDEDRLKALILEKVLAD